MTKVTPGVIDATVYPSVLDKSKNKGYAFVNYDSHRSAATARQVLMNPSTQLWQRHLTVDWAHVDPELDEEITSQVCLSVYLCV